MKQKTWDWIFDIELIIGIIVSAILGIIDKSIPQIFWTKLGWVTLVLLVIILGLRILGKKRCFASLISKWISSITLIFVFNFLTYIVISVLNIVAKSLVSVWSVLGMLLLLVIDIPIVVVNFPVVKNCFLRLFVVFMIFLSYIYNINRFWGEPHWVKSISFSGIVIAIATFILAFFILKAWNFNFNWNLKLIKTKHFQILVLIFLVLFSVWFAFFNTFIYLASTLSELFCFWQWDLSTFKVTTDAIMTAATAGIVEETIRCLNLMILLWTMRNCKWQIVASVFITSIMFSLGHLTNIGINSVGMHFDLETTLQQVMYAFGLGMMFAVIYLYTGKLWLGMLIHGLLDLIAFSRTPLSVMGLPLTDDNWLIAAILMLIPLVVALMMMTGKRLQFMQDNVNRMIDK